ncbi:asparagine synthetase [glutamine-hydrolyzing] 2 [Rhizocola hellebori]|uniref:asparagine synthase (glutamine-hydrolyzing) n=1 Tax=Rhizocola hellebori TaxID=1392758 RepID=A0A8J3VKT3_9ACTN|nr:asparagine synthase (glutamine-hydrolyzing) [Rhizocola hellebori]GIH10809.1 asparagine synthetase [glutamine-hydrolyzing] 2 [Rhizocola hellebori]
MCGIGGVAAVDGTALPEQIDQTLHDMARALAHRGPDAERLLRDGPVALVFQRLSLVDPVGGGQPLSTQDETLFLIANGEVYNHRELEARLPAGTRLKTGSDCEVLLHLYRRDGLRFLDAVQGMYALVLWDKARGKLILARDRFGIKPLYYTRIGGRLAFASEIKALFEVPGCPRRVDWQRALADQFLSAEPVFSHAPVTTWFEQVHTVAAGTIVEVDLRTGALTEHRYWNLPAGGPYTDASDAEFIDAYRELLAASVTACGTADAEIGMFLSGGVDSAAVAMLAPNREAVHSFTALNGSTFVNGDARHAHLVATTFGLPHHQVLFEAGKVPTAQEWKQLLWLLETPLCGPEQYYKYEMYRYAKAIRPQLRAMLLGQASDEFNGGYSVEIAGDGGWEGFTDALADMARRTALSRKPGLTPWWRDGQLPLLRDELLDLGNDPYEDFVAWKYRDVQQYNCWHEDRTAAGNGVEARVPFLDHRIVELTASVSPAQRATLFWDKHIVREAMRGLLPPEIVHRPKVPFFQGDGVQHTYRAFIAMLAQENGSLVEQALSSSRAREFLNPDAVRQMLADLQADSRAGQLEFLLRLVNLGLLEQMTAQLPARPVDAVRAAIPVEVRVADWESEADSLAQQTIPQIIIEPADVPVLDDDVTVLHDPRQDQWYLAVAGSLEYVLDAEWLTFVQHIDGHASVADILARTGIDAAAVGTALADSVELGIVVLQRLPLGVSS